MGKRPRSRRKGSGRRWSPGHKAKGKPEYGRNSGVVVDIINDPMRNAPLAKVKNTKVKPCTMSQVKLRKNCITNTIRN